MTYIFLILKKNFFNKVKTDYLDDKEIERTDKILETFKIGKGEELTQLYLKSEVVFPADMFEKFMKVSFDESDINSRYCVSLRRYIWLCRLEPANTKLKTLQDKELIFSLENFIRAEISSVMVDRYFKSVEYEKILYYDAIFFVVGLRVKLHLIMKITVIEMLNYKRF